MMETTQNSITQCKRLVARILRSENRGNSTFSSEEILSLSDPCSTDTVTCTKTDEESDLVEMSIKSKFIDEDFGNYILVNGRRCERQSLEDTASSFEDVFIFDNLLEYGDCSADFLRCTHNHLFGKVGEFQKKVSTKYISNVHHIAPDCPLNCPDNQCGYQPEQKNYTVVNENTLHSGHRRCRRVAGVINLGGSTYVDGPTLSKHQIVTMEDPCGEFMQCSSGRINGRRPIYFFRVNSNFISRATAYYAYLSPPSSRSDDEVRCQRAKPLSSIMGGSSLHEVIFKTDDCNRACIDEPFKITTNSSINDVAIVVTAYENKTVENDIFVQEDCYSSVCGLEYCNNVTSSSTTENVSPTTIISESTTTVLPSSSFVKPDPTTIATATISTTTAPSTIIVTPTPVSTNSILEVDGKQDDEKDNASGSIISNTLPEITPVVTLVTPTSSDTESIGSTVYETTALPTVAATMYTTSTEYTVSPEVIIDDATPEVNITNMPCIENDRCDDTCSTINIDFENIIKEEAAILGGVFGGILLVALGFIGAGILIAQNSHHNKLKKLVRFIRSNNIYPHSGRNKTEEEQDQELITGLHALKSHCCFKYNFTTMREAEAYLAQKSCLGKIKAAIKTCCGLFDQTNNESYGVGADTEGASRDEFRVADVIYSDENSNSFSFRRPESFQTFRSEHQSTFQSNVTQRSTQSQSSQRSEDSHRVVSADGAYEYVATQPEDNEKSEIEKDLIELSENGGNLDNINTQNIRSSTVGPDGYEFVGEVANEKEAASQTRERKISALSNSSRASILSAFEAYATRRDSVQVSQDLPPIYSTVDKNKKHKKVKLEYQLSDFRPGSAPANLSKATDLTKLTRLRSQSNPIDEAISEREEVEEAVQSSFASNSIEQYLEVIESDVNGQSGHIWVGSKINTKK